MALPPGNRMGPYEILGTIGAGGMGEVYRARDARLAREVAIKVLPASFAADPERLRRFEQEARATGQLNHPNILAVYDTGTHEGVPYVVEELLEGETLGARLAPGPLPLRKALDYARQIALGLSAAHQKGIVHRDLKPENLFVTGDGRVKILDFGLAKLTRPESAGPPAEATSAPTQTGTGAGIVLGTVGYMSPEQVRGQSSDQRSDIFSFGCILYEMLAGRRPFQADTAAETMTAILRADPSPIERSGRDLPPGLARIVQHCLEKSPDERFQSVRDLGFQLEALYADSTSTAVATSGAGGSPALRVARWRVPLWPALAVLVLAAAGAFYAGLGSRAPDPQTRYGQLTFGQGSIFSARFAPEGGTVIYAAAWDGRPAEIFTARPGSPESRPLGLSNAEVLSVSRDGELALLLEPRFTLGWMRIGTLARAPLSGGVPREILKDVQAADWASDGKDLAVIRSVEGRYRLEYPPGKVLYETSNWASSARFSRDGRRIAFIDHPKLGDNRGRVAVVDLSGAVTFLTEPYSSASGVAWSPAGDEIWFTAGMGAVKALRAVDLAGKQRIVDGAPTDMVVADVSPAGKVLIMRNTARRGIAGAGPGGATEHDLSLHDWSVPGALSADGEWLLFSEQGQAGGPEYAVHLRKTDGSPAVRLGAGWGMSLSWDGKWGLSLPVIAPDRLLFLPRGAGESRTVTLPGFQIQWAAYFPDDRRLALTAMEGDGPVRIYTLDVAGGPMRPISPGGVGWPCPLSPDGKRIAGAIGGGPVEVFTVDDGARTPVPASQPDDRPLAFTPDGRAILVGRQSGPTGRIDRIDLTTGARTTWKVLEPADRAGLIDIGFFQVSADNRAYAYSYRRFLSALYQVEGLR